MLCPHRFVIAFAATLLTLAFVVAVPAQQTPGNRQGPGGPGGPGGTGGLGAGPMMMSMFGTGANSSMRLMMLTNEQVQDELKLTKRQKATIENTGETMREVYGEAFASMQGLSPEERVEMGQALEKQTKKLLTKVEGSFDAGQKKRAKELSLQMRGAMLALQDPEVQTALKLSSDQKKELKGIVESIGSGRGFGGPGGGRGPVGGPDQQPGNAAPPARPDGAAPPQNAGNPNGAPGQFQRPDGAGPPQGGGGRGRGGPGGGFMRMMKERNDKALDVLNDDQKATYEKMLGEKFEFQFGPPPGLPGREPS